MSKLHELAELGQSVWYDDIQRSLIRSGRLQALVDQGIRGVTSNPAIFEKAISGSTDYDATVTTLIDRNMTVEAIYEHLAVEDIQAAADILRPVYDSTAALDGFVSLEVSPELAHDTDGTIAEAKRLFATVDRPNVMIKVPATAAGIPAITELIAAGVNVNVTLIFSTDNHAAVAEAYIAGLEGLAAAGGDIDRVGSVASVFVSRVDTAVDGALDDIGAHDLQGTIAVAGAKMTYERFRGIFAGPRWEALAARGARVQRVLWASTGTKNPDYSDTLYVDELIGPDTVNTMPPATLAAFLDHGRVVASVTGGLADARDRLQRLADIGIDLADVTRKLQDDGVAAFARPFQALMTRLGEKIADLRYLRQSCRGRLGSHQSAVERELAALDTERVIDRIWERDHTVWRPEPVEIANRLGWLDSPRVMADAVGEIHEAVDAVRNDGLTCVLLLGMGGSSLAPEVFRKTFGVADGYLDLMVLDSTDPGAVSAARRRFDPAHTLHLVSTKSGGTIETLSFLKYFYTEAMAAVGADRVGRHFAAITDPGSGLEAMARELKFRNIFLNDPDIGGRYSALSYFGLVPAAMIGVDVARILRRAAAMAGHASGRHQPEGRVNTAAWLGAAIGELAAAGRDKLTLVPAEPIRFFGAWVEQLIAESTGKDGKGILPVDGESLLSASDYGNDRVFVCLSLDGHPLPDDRLQALEAAGHPVIRLHLRDPYDLGGEFFRWEMATVIAGRRIGIQPFDQPDVESAKVLARNTMAAYTESGALPEPEPDYRDAAMRVYTDQPVADPERLLGDFLGAAASTDAVPPYVAIQAFVTPDPETDAALHGLRARIQKATRQATTVGYGPRFLHSTGQLHKGDAGFGRFIQLTADSTPDVPIPEVPGETASKMSFGILKAAQAMGDRQALLDGGRRVIRIHVETDVPGTIRRLAETLSSS